MANISVSHLLILHYKRENVIKKNVLSEKLNACTGWQLPLPPPPPPPPPLPSKAMGMNEQKRQQLIQNQSSSNEGKKIIERKQWACIFGWWLGMGSVFRRLLVLLLVNAFYDFDTYWQMSHFHCCHSAKLSSICICSMRAYNIQHPHTHLLSLSLSFPQTHSHNYTTTSIALAYYACVSLSLSPRVCVCVCVDVQSNVISRLLLV